MSKNYKVKWTSNAKKEDLLSIVAYIKQDNLSMVRKVLNRSNRRHNHHSRKVLGYRTPYEVFFGGLVRSDGGMSCGEIALMVRMGREIGKWGDYPITWASMSSDSSSSPRKISSWCSSSSSSPSSCSSPGRKRMGNKPFFFRRFNFR